MRVCIDAGHGGRDPGAIGRQPFELAEKEVTLAVALLLEQELEARGHWAVMTRRCDRSLSLSARAAFANRLGAEVFVSVHANAAASAEAQGMEVFHFPGSPRGQLLAGEILRSLLRLEGHRDRGVKEANFAVLRLTRMPAVVVECEFLTHPAGLEFLADPESQRALAERIADGIESFETHLGTP